MKTFDECFEKVQSSGKLTESDIKLLKIGWSEAINEIIFDLKRELFRDLKTE